MTHYRTIQARRRALRGRAGMTLIEIMIVVGIIATIASGVAVALLPQLERARIKTTKTDAQALRSAVTMFVSENPRSCPTIEELVSGRYLDGSKRTVDAWEAPFTIECESGEIIVSSSGPDGQTGTEDDIK